MKIAYLVSRFPKVSETFILDEILALERQGIPVELFALVRERESVSHPEAAALTERCQVATLTTPALWGAQLYWLLRAPRALLTTWAQVSWSHRGSWRLLVRALAATALAALYALRMQRAGVRHVHAHWATHPALGAWVVHRLTGLSYSFTAHADDLFVQQTMLAEKARDAAFVVTISEYNRRFLAAHCGDTAPPIEVVRCGVRSDAFRPPEDAPAPGFRIACVARLEAKKGHALLIDACAQLVARGLDLHCDLIGEGALRPMLARRIADRGLEDRVHLLGARPRDAVRDLLARATVVALPSVVGPDGRRDGIPVALMEAMAMAKPVVASAISGIPELIDTGRSGLLVAPGDADALAEALERLAHDPALRQRLGDAGRETVLRDFDIDRNARRLAALLTSRLADARPAVDAPALRDAPGVSG